ncbi:DUF4344 domain-containing metallopeptidase [Dongia rigui]|uniref:DUF4344 domain-containing metallopeptidase n=1 Tax=Dongia rigui TaxID=940149 RepID=A0ABU5DW59_9PROT|nr:DUF4344 domain-containing metallopeptidase [Dongia rigui]MDY0871538.1 DUF4344 domain-containing metallopeptidase [Dongia rigui]
MRFGAIIVGAAMAAGTAGAQAAEIDDQVILGALVAEFHISVAASLLPEAPAPTDVFPDEAIIGAAQLIALTGIAEKPQNASEADLGKALDAFLAFAATLDKKDAPLSPKLARLLACQLIGQDANAHAALGAALKIDANAAKACADDAAKAAAQWNGRLSPYRRGPGLTPPEGAGPLYVEIAPVIDEANEAIATSLRRNGLYDSLAERLNAELALPYGRMLLVTECGGPNAFFNPDRREIVLCDERIAAWIAAQGKGT